MTEKPLDLELATAQALAIQAGATVMRLYRDGFEVQYKDAAGTDPVTTADTAANKLLVEGLRRAFPRDTLVAEETPELGGAPQARQTAERVWCIDPIDGTREFVARSGHFMVMLGLAIGRRPVLGVLYQPTEDRLFWGSPAGAFVRDPRGTRRLQVSQIAEPERATLAMSRSHRSPTLARIAAALRIGHTTKAGSVGLKISRLCEAQADVYISTSDRTHEWDICGPEAILEAAGGRVSDLLGRPLRYNGEDTRTRFGICASNGPMHPACLRAIDQILGDRVIDD